MSDVQGGTWMDWRRELQRAIGLEEERVNLFQQMIPMAPSQDIVQMLNRMVSIERDKSV